MSNQPSQTRPQPTPEELTEVVNEGTKKADSPSEAPVAVAQPETPEEETAPEAAAPEDAGRSTSVSAVSNAKEEEDFGAMLERSQSSVVGDEIEVGAKVSGVVAQMGEEESFIDFGGRSEGVIKTSELKDPEGNVVFAIGNPLEAFVVESAGGIVLSRTIGRQESSRTDLLYQAYKSGIPVEGKVTAVNKWGLGVEVQGMRAFCPVAQIDTKFTKDTEEFRGRTMEFKIIRFRDQGRTIVFSRRALLEEAQKEEAVKLRVHIKAGVQIRGTVTRLESFGAFVDLGAGVEGLVHVSELRHERVQHPKDVVESGQEIDVVVLKTKELGVIGKERISLSVKALEKDPWHDVRERFQTGAVTLGKVESIEDYGAFVELGPNVRGMVHISEMDNKRIAHPRDVVSLGDEVKVAVVEIDNKRRRLRLSMKQADALEDQTNLKDFQKRQQQGHEARDSGNAMMDALKRAGLTE